MQDSLPAGGLRLYREGVEPSGSLRKVSGYISILLSRTCPVPRVVYAKKPFGGPQAVLAYLSRYTHRVAISLASVKRQWRRAVGTRAPWPLVIRITSPTRSTSSVAMTCAAPALMSCAFFSEVRVSAMVE